MQYWAYKAYDEHQVTHEGVARGMSEENLALRLRQKGLQMFYAKDILYKDYRIQLKILKLRHASKPKHEPVIPVQRPFPAEEALGILGIILVAAFAIYKYLT